MEFEKLFSSIKEKQLFGRYVAPKHIAPLLENLKEATVEVIGKSVLHQPIHSITIGSGKKKILMWSQMHGNESTTTKALFDFLNFLESDHDEAKAIKKSFCFCIIPMLNPDGAAVYTRENANLTDLNRDFCDLNEPESKLLFEVFKDFKPDYCFNMHDQRTIYAAGYSRHPATVSFLAPSFNEAREINESREKAIAVIAAMNDVLQTLIPNQVGRFDDSFNINCVGDTFQFNNVPTILFEAGHYQHDYDREQTRKFIFIALVAGLNYIRENVIVNNRIADYLNIPQNMMTFYDFAYKNVKINYDGNEIITNFAAQYKEELVGDKISFVAYIAEIGFTDGIHAHCEYDAKQQTYSDDSGGIPNVDQNADFYLGDVKFVNGSRNDI